MEKSNLCKINKDRLNEFLDHLKKKNKSSDETLEKCLVSSILRNLIIIQNTIIRFFQLPTYLYILFFLILDFFENFNTHFFKLCI